MKRSIGHRETLFPCPVWIIGTYDSEGKPNLMTVAWGGIVCSKPASVCISIREATHSYRSIVERGAFTVNVPNSDQVREADFAGIASGRDTDKFAATGLTPVRSGHVDAPMIAEFPLNVECELAHTVPIGLHTLFVGEIRDVKADESILDEKDTPLIRKVNPPIWAPAELAYYSTGEFIGAGLAIGKDLVEK